MYNIVDYGAVSGGKELCTAAIQTAIEDCAKNGGGTVLVPAGLWLTGSIFLRSHVELHLENGATLKGSPNLDDYNADDAYPENYGWAPEKWNAKHLIIVYRCEDVAITGGGTIDGSGEDFFEPCPPTHHYYGWMDGLATARDKERLRPGQTVCFILSDRIRLEDVAAKNATCWTFFFLGCEYVTIRGVRINNPSYFVNTDGIDLDCCHYVTVSDCIIRTGDDCITFRGCIHRQTRFKDCAYITVTNCVLNSCACAFRIGVGRGLIHDIRVSNIVVERSSTAMCYCCGWAKSPSYMENVNFNAITVCNSSHAWTIGGRSWGQAGSVRNCTISEVTADVRATNYVMAQENCTIENITLRNIDIHFRNLPDYNAFMREERGEDMVVFENVKGLRTENLRVSYEEAERETWRDVERCIHVERAQ